jgi:GT2 family glycosyltransferase
MYCEDVDLCLRLQLAGYRLVEAPQARVVHDAHRASRRSLRHLVWHLRSLWRLWHSTPYQRFLAQRRPVTIQG